LSKEDKIEIGMRYCSGESVSNIARRVGCTTNSIYRWCYELGINSKTKEKWLEDHGGMMKLKELQEAGKSKSEIVEETGYSESMVTKTAQKMKLSGFFGSCKYEEQMASEMIKFYRQMYRDLKYLKKKKGSDLSQIVDIMSLEMYAIEHLDVTPQTAKKWAAKGSRQIEEGDEFKQEYGKVDYRKFAYAWDVCVQIYEDILVKAALNRKLDATTSIFVMKNKTSLKDVKAIELTGRDGEKFMPDTDSMGKKQMKELKDILGIQDKEGEIERFSEDESRTLLKHIKPAHD